MSTSASVCFSRCVAFLDRWAYLESDTDVERIRKRTATAGTLVQCIGGAMLLANVSRFSQLHTAMSIYAFSQSTLLLASLRVRRQAGVRFLALMSATFMFYIMVADWISAAENNRRVWPLSILMIDMLLSASPPPLDVYGGCHDVRLPHRHTSRGDVAIRSV